MQKKDTSRVQQREERIMQCKLCHNEVEVLCQSHIIPEFMYTPLYDDKHKMLGIKNSFYKKEVLQKGIKKQLLCRDCEERLNKYETYVAKKWQNDWPLPERITKEIYKIEGLDYHKFKLFHLSILWRTHVSRETGDRKKDFKGVNLGQHADKIRKLILSGDAGLSTQYYIAASLVVNGNGEPVRMISLPWADSVDGHRVYKSIFGRCEWLYFVGNHTHKDIFPVSFTEDGILYLGVKQITKMDYVQRVIRKNKGF